MKLCAKCNQKSRVEGFGICVVCLDKQLSTDIQNFELMYEKEMKRKK